MLAEGLERDELARHALAGRQLAAADPERDRGVALERRAPDLLEPATVLLGPREVLAGQETAPGREQSDQRRTPAAWPVALRNRRLGAVDRLLGSFKIDPGVPPVAVCRTSAPPGSTSPPSTARSRESSALKEASAPAGARHGQSASISSSRRAASARFTTRYVKSTRAWPPGRVRVSSRPASSTASRPQSWIRVGALSANVCARRIAEFCKPAVVASRRVIKGEGHGEGHSVSMRVSRTRRDRRRGGRRRSRQHMRSDHPELVGKVTREDLKAMAEEA